MKCFNVSYLLTTVAGLGAALKGAAGAPTETSRDLTAPTEVRNSPLPRALEQALWNRYEACRQYTAKNPRIFGAQPLQGIEGICVADAGLSAAFQHALTAPPSDMLVARAGIHNLAASRASNPLDSAEFNAGYTSRQLKRINAHDYRDSGTASWLADRQTLVRLLKEHIAPEDRRSLERATAAYRACEDVLQGKLEQLARKQVAERTELAINRSIGAPGTINQEQLDDLRDDLMPQQFGNSGLKQRMVQDALDVLVAEHRQAMA